MTIAGLLARNARYRPDHLAVVCGEQRLCYRDFNRRVNRLANALNAIGIRKGDKVATLLGNRLEILEAYWAAAKIGVVAVPLSPLLRGKALETLIRDSDSEAVIADAVFAPVLEALRPALPLPADRYVFVGGGGSGRDYAALVAGTPDAEPEPVVIDGDDPYNIIYSSGTTGAPKGIVLTHRIRAMYCALLASTWRMTPESVVLHAGSLVFNGSFLTLMPAMYLGATFILHRQFDAEAFVRTVAEERVTHVMMVPSQILALLHSPAFSADALASLQLIGSVGAPLHREHKEDLSRRLPGRLSELYGLTEGFVTVLDRDDLRRKPGSVGVPPPFYEMRILDPEGGDVPPGTVGEIAGRGPILMPGYYKRPDLTRQAIVDGWLRTGDMGYVDEDGYLFLVDRKKDLIISGGINVYPRDIEEVVVQHPAVKEAAVFGIPSDKWGEAPLAAVIPRTPGAISEQDLKEWINERVGAQFQRVAQVVFLTDFPRSTAGKTLKRELREPYWAGRGDKI